MPDFKKIYLGDYSKEGYDNGIDDAKHHRPKNKFKFFKAIHPINYVWNFNNAYDSFTQNYNEGYLDGQRVVNEVYNSNTHKGEHMAQSEENYERHLQMLDKLKENLTTLTEYLDDITTKYQQQINAMASAGFTQNIIDGLEKRHIVFDSKIKKLQDMIQNHKREIELHEEALENLINTARS